MKYVMALSFGVAVLWAGVASAQVWDGSVGCVSGGTEILATSTLQNSLSTGSASCNASGGPSADTPPTLISLAPSTVSAGGFLLIFASPSSGFNGNNAQLIGSDGTVYTLPNFGYTGNSATGLPPYLRLLIPGNMPAGNYMVRVLSLCGDQASTELPVTVTAAASGLVNVCGPGQVPVSTSTVAQSGGTPSISCPVPASSLTGVASTQDWLVPNFFFLSGPEEDSQNVSLSQGIYSYGEPYPGAAWSLEMNGSTEIDPGESVTMTQTDSQGITTQFSEGTVPGTPGGSVDYDLSGNFPANTPPGPLTQQWYVGGQLAGEVVTSMCSLVATPLPPSSPAGSSVGTQLGGTPPVVVLPPTGVVSPPSGLNTELQSYDSMLSNILSLNSGGGTVPATVTGTTGNTDDTNTGTTGETTGDICVSASTAITNSLAILNSLGTTLSSDSDLSQSAMSDIESLLSEIAQIISSFSQCTTGQTGTTPNPPPISPPTSPQLSLNETTSGSYPVGTPWTLTLTSSIPSTSFTICAIDNGSQSCTPNWGTTDANGNYTQTGTFPASTIGNWTEWVEFPNGTNSNQISFTVTAAGSLGTIAANVTFPATILVTAQSLNVRPAASLSASPVGSFSAGDTFTATGETTGDTYEGNDIWYISSQGNQVVYVWSGGGTNEGSTVTGGSNNTPATLTVTYSGFSTTNPGSVQVLVNNAAQAAQSSVTGVSQTYSIPAGSSFNVTPGNMVSGMLGATGCSGQNVASGANFNCTLTYSGSDNTPATLTVMTPSGPSGAGAMVNGFTGGGLVGAGQTRSYQVPASGTITVVPNPISGYLASASPDSDCNVKSVAAGGSYSCNVSYAATDNTNYTPATLTVSIVSVPSGLSGTGATVGSFAGDGPIGPGQKLTYSVLAGGIITVSPYSVNGYQVSVTPDCNVAPVAAGGSYACTVTYAAPDNSPATLIVTMQGTPSVPSGAGATVGGFDGGGSAGAGQTKFSVPVGEGITVSPYSINGYNPPTTSSDCNVGSVAAGGSYACTVTYTQIPLSEDNDNATLFVTVYGMDQHGNTIDGAGATVDSDAVFFGTTLGANESESYSIPAGKGFNVTATDVQGYTADTEGDCDVNQAAADGSYSCEVLYTNQSVNSNICYPNFTGLCTGGGGGGSYNCNSDDECVQVSSGGKYSTSDCDNACGDQSTF